MAGTRPAMRAEAGQSTGIAISANSAACLKRMEEERRGDRSRRFAKGPEAGISLFESAVTAAENPNIP
jgi:hypothetical protein